jgi:hypothetical protein
MPTRDGDRGAPRLALAQHEAAYVLRISENEVRNRLRRGALRGTRSGRQLCVDADELARQIAGDELALLVLRRVMAGRLEVPRNWDPSVPAPDLLASLNQLM